MSEGLWIAPDKFLTFADMAADRDIITRELYSSPFGFDPISFLSYLPDPDPVLRKTGDGVSVLRDLTADDKVLSSMQQRKLGVLKKQDYQYSAGHKKEKPALADALAICSQLEDDLENVDLYDLFSQVLDAPYYGMTPVEIIWEARGGMYHIADLRPRPTEWFTFNSKNELLFNGAGGPEDIPFGKIVLARHFPDSTNPYGLRLLSRCLWPVAIKKGGIKFWTMLCEKFGTPWVVGKAPSGALEPDRQRIAAQLRSMVQDAIAVVSSGTEVDIHGIEAKSGGLHPELVNYMDSSIARVLMLQTLTSEVGNTGSYAVGKVHEGVLDDCRDADEKILTTFMDNLAWTYTLINSATAMSPVFTFIEPEDYDAEADLDTKLYSVGVRFTKKHFKDRYKLSEDEFEIEENPSGAGTPGRGKVVPGVALATPGDFTPDQQAIEDFIAQIIPDAAESLKGNEQLIIKAVLSSDSYEEAFEKLLDLYPELSVDKLETLMETVQFNAEMFGRYVIRQEAGK